MVLLPRVDGVLPLETNSCVAVPDRSLPVLVVTVLDVVFATNRLFSASRGLSCAACFA